MSSVKVSKSYRVTIPPEIRRPFNIRPGIKLAFIPYERTIQLVVVHSIEDAHATVNGLDMEGVGVDDDAQA
jgi:AbrB family looped-hinge helix DNA binding protein